MGTLVCCAISCSWIVSLVNIEIGDMGGWYGGVEVDLGSGLFCGDIGGGVVFGVD